MFFLVGVAASGQSQVPQRWQLPPGGTAVFDADEELRWFPVADPKSRPSRPLSHCPHVPILFASELDDELLRPRSTPIDVRGLAPAVAFDLGSARQKRFDQRFDWVVAFGNLWLRGAVAHVSADGVQKLELRITGERPKQRSDQSEDEFGRWLARQRLFDANGTLVVERRFDALRSVVESFDARLELDCVRLANGEKLRLELEQHWRLTELREHRGGGFQGRIAESVRRGAAWLHDQLAARTRWDRFRETSHSTGPGVWALMLLTLLHAEYDPNGTVMRARMAQVRRAELTETYTLSLAILLLEKLYAPRGERAALISGALAGPVARQPSAADRLLLEQWTRRLLDNRDRAVDRAYVSRWGYTGNGYDNSNTQFALLALHAAALCGVEVSRGVWHSAAQHLLAEQAVAEGKEVRLQLIPHRDASEAGAPRLLDRSAPLSAPRGFGYRGAAESPYGAMTAAGVSGATLCLANLTDEHGKRAAEFAAVQQVVRDGFAWLSRHRTVRRVAGDNAGHQDYHFNYWLYSLERACELSQTAWIGEWDWYNDGAELLLATQKPDGSWGSQVDTCFALLFLKQAQLPVITGLRDDPEQRRR